MRELKQTLEGCNAKRIELEAALSELEKKTADTFFKELHRISEALEKRDALYRLPSWGAGNKEPTETEEELLTRLYEKTKDADLKKKIENDYLRINKKQEAKKKLEGAICAGVRIRLNPDESAYLYPSIKYENREKHPSLMKNLMSSVVTAINEVAKGPDDFNEEQERGFVRIKVKNVDLEKLVNALREFTPDEFEKANVDYLVISPYDKQLSEQLSVGETAKPSEIEHGESWLTIKEAVKKYKISQIKIKRACKDGLLYTKKVEKKSRYGFSYLIFKSDLEKKIEQGVFARKGTATRISVDTTEGEDEMIDTTEAGKILGVHAMTIGNRIRNKYLPAQRVGNGWKLYKTDVENYKAHGKLLSKKEAAEILGKQPSSVTDYIRRNLLQGEKIGKSRRVYENPVKRLKESLLR